jgi:4-hydroxy-3-methylbut-2-enyl diphosphate reductase
VEIIRAAHAGFCQGVRRAARLALEQAEQPGKCYILGPLVHNQAAIDDLARRGITAAPPWSDLKKGDTVIIPSHGVGPEVLRQAENLDLTVIDATCPLVKRIHQIVAMLAEENYDIILFGDPEHSETQGIMDWSRGKAVVVSSEADLPGLMPGKKWGMISQTTKDEEAYFGLARTALALAEEFRFYNTICPAVKRRQTEAVRLAAQVELMVVIGDQSSSNTRTLHETCARSGVKTLFIQSAQDLNADRFTGLRRVGVTAGASTPDWVIKEVVDSMSQFEDEKEVAGTSAGYEPGELTGEPTAAEEPSANLPVEKPCTDCVAVPTEEAQVPEVNPATVETHVPTESAEADEADAADAGEENFAKLEAAMAEAELPGKGDIIKGRVIQVLDDEVMVDVGGKSEGIIPSRELSSQEISSAKELYKVGDEIDVLVLRWDDDGTILLSKKKVENMAVMNDLEKVFENGEIIEGTVTESIKGGMLVDIGISAFLPASHVDLSFIKNLDDYVGKTFEFKIIEFNKNKKRGSQIVVSRKDLLEAQRSKEKEAFWASIQEGQTVTGKVKRLVEYGAFVDLGGFEGLLHVSEMDHVRIDNPATILSEGDDVDLYILAVDREKERVSLSRKKLLKSPWDVAVESIHEGDVIEGSVMRMTTFGAFVEVIPGVDGLVHISQIADHRINRPEDVLTKGQKVWVKVLNVDQSQKRIGLSIKDVAQDAEEAEIADYLNNQEAEDGEGYTADPVAEPENSDDALATETADESTADDSTAPENSEE